MPLQPEKSDTRNPETAANFAKTNCAWSGQPHAQVCKYRKRRPPCSSSECRAARRNCRMKTRRCVCLCFRNDRTSAHSANLPPAHRRNSCQGEPARSKLFRTPDRMRSEEHTSELQSHVNLVC